MDSVSVEKLHFIKGNCYIELKDYANAVLELQAAVRLQGAGTESYRSLAIALANDGKLEEAQQEQYPSDYRFDMQMAYLLIDWQGARQTEQRDYRQAENCYASAVEKYRQAQANGTEDTQMAVLKNLIDQLRTSGWLK